MSTVTLYGDHLAGGKPAYPNYCVVCNRESEDYFLMPVAVSGGSAILHDLFRIGDLHRVSVHAGDCRNKLKRDFFTRRQLPHFVIAAYVALLIPAGYLLGIEYAAIGATGVFPIAFIQAWIDYKKPVLFEARVEIDDWGRGLLTVEVANESYARRFAEQNAQALYLPARAG